MARPRGKDHYLFGKKRPGVGGVEEGNIPWNKGKKTGLIPRTAFKEGSIPANKGVSNKTPCKKCGTQDKDYRSDYCRACWVGTVPSNFKEMMANRPSLKGRYDKKHYQEIGLKGLVKQQNSKEPTSIEKKVYAELKRRGLLIEIQKLINGKFLVDAYIPSLNLVIEADGDYWHSLDRVKKRDKAKNAYLKTCGFGLLRLSESEINSGAFVEKLEEVLV